MEDRHAELQISDRHAASFDERCALLAAATDPLFLLSRTRLVIRSSHTPERLASRCVMLRIEAGLLRANRSEEDRELQTSIDGLTADRPAALVRLQSREGAAVALLDMLLLLRREMVLLRVTILVPPPQAVATRLADALGLTPAEARVATGVLAGLSFPGLCTHTGTGTETVRTHLKRIRAKTGTRSQLQLAELLRRVPPALEDAPARHDLSR